ncbi:MAG TPA: alpha/beta hydrolase [Candidatus Binataceae bacterium]|nr:alpha/beta hydrolase [Candidatus Binataceae bacterium]
MPTVELLRVPTTSKPEHESFSDFLGLYPRVHVALHLPAGKRPRTVVIGLHPTAASLLHPTLRAMVDRGFAAIGMAHRFYGNDSRLFMEELLLDLGGAVRFARQRGFENVVLIGSSGGGSVVTTYQSQAESPTITSTPAGDPPDLTREELPSADGIILVAAHPGRPRVLTDSLDPSVVDESDPHATDSSLDMYDPRNGPPYSPEFIARYRAAQEERNHRITRWCWAKLAELKQLGDGGEDLQFPVYRTNADLCFLDPAVDPSERTTGTSASTYRGDLRTVNRNAYGGMARCSTYRSWLSQWSLSASNADGYHHASRISKPFFIVNFGADEGVFPRYSKGYYEAVSHSDKELVTVAGAHHFVHTQPEVHNQAMDLLANWMRRKGF